MLTPTQETTGFQQDWANAIVTWAAQHERIAKVFLFGSRAKGYHRSDSDLDLAVVISGPDALAYGICFAEKWRAELSPLLPVKLHLQITEENSDLVVWKAIEDHGVEIYPA